MSCKHISHTNKGDLWSDHLLHWLVGFGRTRHSLGWGSLGLVSPGGCCCGGGCLVTNLHRLRGWDRLAQLGVKFQDLGKKVT